MAKMTELRDARKMVQDVLKYNQSFNVKVKVFECWDDEEPTYDVEVNWYDSNDCYVDGLMTDTFDNGKDAMKRAKAVHKAVKGWLEYGKPEVADEIEHYTA